MQNSKLWWDVVCVVASLVFTGAVFAKKVVVVTALNTKTDKATLKEIGYQDVFDGIEEVAKGAGHEVVHQWYDLDAAPDAQGKSALGQSAVEKIKGAGPDVVIVVGGDSLRYIGIKIDEIPVVFTYVFSHVKTFPELPKPNIAGVTRKSYAADIWALANQLLGAKTVALMSKDNTAMQGVKKYLTALADKLEAASGVRYKDMFLVNTFEEWQAAVNNFPEDFIYLADTSRVLKDGKEMPRGDVTAWTVANSKVPVIAATEIDAEAGALYSIVTSEKNMGKKAAEVALDILGGKSPADIKYVQSKKGKLVINMKTAQQYGLEIPYEILESAERVIE